MKKVTFKFIDQKGRPDFEVFVRDDISVNITESEFGIGVKTTNDDIIWIRQDLVAIVIISDVKNG